MQSYYKILLSAYACEPNKGSEQGVGWHWAIEIAMRGHEVWVITRKNNQAIIEKYFAINLQPCNLHFIYYDVPISLSWWKKGVRGVHLYYYLWQIGIFSLSQKLHRELHFDIVHHITFVTIHQPSFLFLLTKTNFVYGPAAGGDIIATRFMKDFPINQKVKEILRYIQCLLLTLDPVRQWMYNKTDFIYCNSAQTKSFLPNYLHNKMKLSLAIGVDSLNDRPRKSDLIKTNHLRLLYVGNFLHLKGLHLTLKAFGKLKASNPNIQLTLIGKGKFKEADELKHQLDIHSWMPQNELLNIYSNYDLMVFPSFRDSGGMVVLEAMSKGLPAICLDLGGPGQIVNETCGRVISTKEKSEEEVIDSISRAILEFQQNPVLLQQLSNGAVQRANEFTWKKTVARVYEEIEEYMDRTKPIL